MSKAKLAAPKAPDAYRSIGEAAAELGLQTHVLRYWESKFPRQLKPVKRKDGRRMFRPADMDALRAIQKLVHDGGMTLRGAKLVLQEQGVELVLSGEATITGGAAAVKSPARELQQKLASALSAEIPDTDIAGSKERLESVLQDMNSLKARLDAVRSRRAA